MVSDEETASAGCSSRSVSRRKGVEIPPPESLIPKSRIIDPWVAEKMADPKFQEMCAVLEEGYQLYKNLYRPFRVLARLRAKQSELRHQELERSVRGDLEKVVVVMLRANWAKLSAEEVFERIDTLSAASNALHVLKVRMRREAARSRPPAKLGLAGFSLVFWTRTAREMGVVLGFRRPDMAVRAYVRALMLHVGSGIVGELEDWLRYFRIRKFIEYCRRAGLC